MSDGIMKQQLVHICAFQQPYFSLFLYKSFHVVERGVKSIHNFLEIANFRCIINETFSKFYHLILASHQIEAGLILYSIHVQQSYRGQFQFLLCSYASLAGPLILDYSMIQGSQSSTRVPPAPRGASAVRGDMTRTTQP